MRGWGFSMYRSIIVTGMAVWSLACVAEPWIDPTKPPAAVMEYLPEAQSQAEKPWALSAVQHNGKNGFAVVNGQMVQVGERYEGFKLVAVENGQARFVSQSGEKKQLSMGITSFMPTIAEPAGAKTTRTKKSKKVK